MLHSLESSRRIIFRQGCQVSPAYVRIEEKVSLIVSIIYTYVTSYSCSNPLMYIKTHDSESRGQVEAGVHDE